MSDVPAQAPEVRPSELLAAPIAKRLFKKLIRYSLRVCLAAPFLLMGFLLWPAQREPVGGATLSAKQIQAERQRQMEEASRLAISEEVTR